MSKPTQTRGADRRRFHVIYKTTCTITGRWYIGMHSTDELNDGYLGSGQRLWHSIRKHGKENHVYEILEHLPSRELLIERETQIVTHELIKDPMCMNLVLGGKGDWGWGATSTEERTAARLKKMSEAWDQPGFRESFKEKTSGRKRSEEAKVKMKSKWTPERRAAQALALAERNKKRFEGYWETHKTKDERRKEAQLEFVGPRKPKGPKSGSASAETRKLMSDAKRGKSLMHQGQTVKWVDADEVENYLSQGWLPGTGNHQKPREVSAETKAKLAEAARQQHARRKACLHLC